MYYSVIVIIILFSRIPWKPSMVLTGADHLFIHNYISSLLNISVKLTLLIRMGLKLAPY